MTVEAAVTSWEARHESAYVQRDSFARLENLDIVISGTAPSRPNASRYGLKKRSFHMVECSAHQVAVECLR